MTLRTMAALQLEMAKKNSGDTFLDLADQETRLQNIQCVLSHAQTLMQAICYDRMSEQEIRAATYFADQTLERMADGVAQDAVLFTMIQIKNAKDAKAETGK